MKSSLSWYRALLIALAACSSSSTEATGSEDAGTLTFASCDDLHTSCPNGAPTEQEIKSCNEELAGPCATEFKAWQQCTINNQSCTADGQRDFQVIALNCSDTQEAFYSCREQDGGPTGG